MALVHPSTYQAGLLHGDGNGPAAQSMDDTPIGPKSPGLVMQQRNGWCDCRLGFSIQPWANGVPPPNSVLPPPPFSLWQSGSFCARIFTCTPTYKQYVGDVTIDQMDTEESLQNRVAFTHEKPNCVCCPTMVTRDASGAIVGRTVRQCTLCMPSYGVESGIGELIYTVSPDAICFCFPKCNMGGGGACCQIPWYIRDPATSEHLPNDAHIMHVWTGMKREFCTPNTTVRCSFPPQANTNERATLLGSTLLITLMAKQEAKEQEQQQQL